MWRRFNRWLFDAYNLYNKTSARIPEEICAKLLIVHELMTYNKLRKFNSIQKNQDRFCGLGQNLYFLKFTLYLASMFSGISKSTFVQTKPTAP